MLIRRACISSGPIMKPTDCLTLACLAFPLLHSLGEQAPPDIFSNAAVAGQIQKLGADHSEDRKSAMAFMETWATSEPDKARQKFLSLLSDANEPEVRERCLKLLKRIAIREYGKFGEGYVGITMGMEEQIVLPGDGKPCFGIPVTWVTKDSPAEKGGIQPGDIIVSLDDIRWRQQLEISDLGKGLSAKIRAKGAGNKAVFGIWKNEKLMSLEIELSRRPANLENTALMRIIPNGGILKGGGFQVDPAELAKLVEEDKSSDKYFAEWLERQFPKKADK